VREGGGGGREAVLGERGEARASAGVFLMSVEEPKKKNREGGEGDIIPQGKRSVLI